MMNLLSVRSLESGLQNLEACRFFRTIFLLSKNDCQAFEGKNIENLV